MTTETKSAGIGVSFSLAIHIVLAAALLLFGQSVIKNVTLPQGRKVMQMRLTTTAPRQEPARKSPPTTKAPTPKPKPAPRPKPAPAPRPVAVPDEVPPPEPETPTAPDTEPVPESSPPSEPAQAPEEPMKTAPRTDARASAPAGDPVGEQRLAKLKERVPAVLRARLEAAKQYPFIARRAGITGTVPVEILVSGDGHILSAAVAESATAHKWLLKGADKTLDALSRDPVFTGPVLDRDMLVTVPLVYELR